MDAGDPRYDAARQRSSMARHISSTVLAVAVSLVAITALRDGASRVNSGLTGGLSRRPKEKTAC